MRQLVESEERARKALMPARAFKADGSVELTQTAEQKAALVGSIKRKVASGDYSGTKRNKHAAIEKELRWNHAEARTGLKVKHAEELHEDTFLEHERAVSRAKMNDQTLALFCCLCLLCSCFGPVAFGQVLNKQAAEAVYVAAEAGRITARKAKEAAAGAVSVKKQANNRTALALLGN